MNAGRNTIIAAALATAAAGLGFACGSSAATKKKPTSTLPAAGSPRDDGTGLLARWSVASPESGGDLALGAGVANLGQGGNSYGGNTYGMYGGSLYGAGSQGGNSYGGSLYANYRFNANFTTTSPYPTPAPTPARTYTIDYNQTRGGSIEGTVKWPRPPRAAKSVDGCDGVRDNETLAVDRDGGVANAIVFIEGIGKGRAGYTPVGGILERVDCAFRPHVQVMAPAGQTALRITNSDEGARTISVTPRKKDKGATARQVEIARRGQTERAAMTHAGFFRVEVEGDAASHAWVVVAEHPYYTVTDESGGFRLDGLPSGTHTLVVWHEPVITGFGDDGTPKLTKAFVTKKKIKVSAKKSTSVTIKLPSGR